MIRLGYPVIDLHTHLRRNISSHTKRAWENGISTVVYMANSKPPLDNLTAIKRSLKVKRYCRALPVSAITRGLKGKKLVKVDEIKPFVVGFSDDGQYLKNLNLLKAILEKGVLVLAHCSPSYKTGVGRPELETRNIKEYLNVLENTGGRLHIQHISKKESVALIREAKRKGLKITCETCPQYFTFTNTDLDVRINPPLATKRDVTAVKEGLADGTIDVIASDYAPEPRKTGIAGFNTFVPLAYGLVLEKVLSENQLKQKISTNPKKIIEGRNNHIT